MTYWLGRGHDVYACFNNDNSGFAIEDARWLADRLRTRSGLTGRSPAPAGWGNVVLLVGGR